VFLAHREGDDVAVAVRDADPGGADGAYLESGTRFEIGVRAKIPLGHKVALRDLAVHEDVIEYGAVIGVTRCPVAAGDLVHTHNLRSARWQRST
jgi:(2R)-sulfolactate sulfo-lyase subunit alpha